ncbi:hypothetical protein CR165_03665 [Pseudoroseomonas aestuarii]|uniref:Lipoprotein n=2 Tax=Teichococcus aestuarii TaxID=568898 RepID=A0A2U1V7T4_9PROT|nr:hypothetical protein CR165_03665 [Pseudoroseomonas aestuarii]
MRAGMRISAWGAALLSLAACAGWEKPGATGAERQAALGRCEAAGRQIPPEWQDYVERPGYWEPSVTECGRDGRRCWTSPGGFRPPQYRTRDAAAPLRATVIEACMRDQGWTRKEGL